MSRPFTMQPDSRQPSVGSDAVMRSMTASTGPSLPLALSCSLYSDSSPHSSLQGPLTGLDTWHVDRAELQA
jgi:hypothetical protein